MQAFVTGSTGLLGSNLTRLLVQRNHQVKALVRSREKAKKVIGDLDVTLVDGDLQDVDGFVKELRGCNILFHTAAYFREYFLQPGDHTNNLYNINVTRTLELLAEAERSGIQKVIYVSSAGVIGKEPSGAPSDELAPADLIPTNDNPYYKSRAAAEDMVYAFLRGHRLPIVLILPGWMFGPSDASLTNSGRLVIDFLKRRLPGVVDGGEMIVDARDVAQVMLNAVEKGRRGERYLVAGEYHTIEEVFMALEKVSGVPSPKRHIPYAASLAFAWASEALARFQHKPTQVTVNGIQVLRYDMQLSSEKAIQELDCRFRALEETLRDEVEWYRAHHYV